MDREKERKLLAEDLTKELIKEMSDEEVLLWDAELTHQAEIAMKRAALLNFVDVQEAKRGPRIHVDSTVVD